MKTSLSCFIFLFSLLLPLAGQDGSGGGQKREAGRSVWFVYTDMPEGVENPVKVLAGGKITEVKLDPYMASDPMDIPAEGLIRIVRETPGRETGGKPEFQVLAEAKVPDKVREALIILTPLPKPEGNLIFQAKVQDLASFKGGDRLFINLSNTNVAVKIGETPVAVPAKQANIYSAPKLADATNMPIVYTYYHPEQQKWKLLTASTVVVMPTRRQICIFNDGSRIGKIKKHGILFPVAR